MSRPNSRSANRFSDAQHQRRIQLQIDLLRAIKDKEDEHLRRFFGDAIKGPDALDSEGFYVILLRTIEKGHASAVEYLLRNGASPAQQRIKSRPLTSPLIRAVTSKNPNLDIVSLLLEYGDESMIDAADDQGRTAIMLAALSGNSKIVSRLIDFGADVNTLETQGRNVLHLVAAKICTLSTQEDLNILRTLWNSRLNFFAQDNLGRNPLHWACANGKHELVDELAQKYRADTTTDRRGKTYLHLAIAHGHTDVLRALINRQFDVHAKSHGGWTALHSASATGNLDAVILLTSAKVDVDARLRHGSTPLHLAAKKGYHAIVEHLLSHSAQPASKDNFGRTPFLLAAEGQHTSILACLFTKARPERESEAERACRNNSITMLNFGEYELDKDNIVHHFSLYDVLYKRDPQSRQTPPFRITPPPHRRTRVRWLHLPANNIEWVEALFDKIYLEEGSMTIESYRVLQKSLHDYRKALLDHSPFVGPLCYGTEGAATKVSLGNPDDDKPLPYRPFHLAMPYLHYETNSGRRQMQEALREIENRKGPSRVPTTEGDKLLLSGYSNTSPRPIQLRRTLDQFYLRGVDTEHRDIDQVVYRYQIASGNKDPRIYMVDELWMWLVTEDLIVTCFPRRWEQSEDDELDVLGGLISEINSGLLGELQSVHEVAQLITRRCIGTFDRHSPDPAYHFFQMFRASIDKAIDQEAQLFFKFQEASKEKDSSSSEKDNYRRRKYDKFIGYENLVTIGAETQLVVELKDIRDELFILRTVLLDQRRILDRLQEIIRDAPGIATGKLGFRGHFDILEINLSEVDRMEEKTKKTLASLNTLLDMKEKHMSLSTTQSAQEQAVRSSTQGDAILIFTLVTVVFSPLSFIAAFFTINIREFPGADQDHGMPLGYVSKYLFGIGMAISILVVLLALLLNELRYVLAWGKEWQLKSWVTFSKSIWSYLWDRKKSKKPMMIQKKIPDEELGRRTASKSIDSKCLNGAVGAHLRLDVGRQSSRYRSNGRAQD